MRFLVILLTPFLCLICYSQKETSNWFLYQNRISVAPTGVTTGLPLPAPGFNPTYASTSVSDSLGNLLFACDGNKIIDKNLTVMPALTNVNFYCGNGNVLAQKIPGSTKYYVFYNSVNSSASNSSWTLKYAIVDLSLNNGAGDVTIYDQVIDTALSKGFTLAQGAGTQNAWLVTHHKGTDSFFSYKITPTGLSNTAIASRAGTDVTLGDYFFVDLKTSPDGKMIAGVTYRDYTVLFAYTFLFAEVFDFDPVLGKLTNRVRSMRLGNYFFSYLSVDFSPDNRLLYVGLMQRVCCLQPCGFGAGAVWQFDLCYTDSVSFTRYSMIIARDFQFCGPGVSWGNIQLGADKRIHMPYTGNMVSTISKPNRVGSYSGYTYNSYQLPNLNNGYIATPRFQHRLLEKAVKNNIVYHGGCYPSPITFSITNDTISSFLWNFGDPASANNISNLSSPSHVFSSPGFYTVTAQLFNSSAQLIDTLSELVEIKDPSKRVLWGYPTDTSFCAGNSMNIQLSAVNGIFNWYQVYNGVQTGWYTTDNYNISQSGTYYVQMRQNDCDGCFMLDSIHVTVLPVPYINLGPDRNLCTGDSMQLSVYAPTASFIWNTGDTTNSIWIHQGGVYWVQAEFDNNGCPKRDSINITSVPGVQFSLPNDTTLCNNQTLLLSPGVTNASYQWQNGSTQTTFTVTQQGTYWVNITSTNGCHHADTIHVNYINAQQVFLGNDTTLCAGDSLLLHSNVANAQYLWNTGSTADHITVNQTGSYWITVNNGSCTVTDTIMVIFHPPPNLFLGNDSTLCEHDSLVLHAGSPGATYLWQNGSVGESFTVTQPGAYSVRLQQYGCTVRDTINILYYSIPVIDLGSDVSFCTGDSAVFNAGNGFSQYLWNTGAVSQQLVVYNTGNYSVIATTADGCKAYDSVRVLNLFPLPVIQLDHDTTLCTGDSRILDAGPGFVSYLWNDGSASRTKIIFGIGLYAVTVTNNNGCRRSDTTTIKKLLPLPSLFLPADTAICSYGTLDIQASSNYTQYLWNTNATTRKITISLPGIYWLRVTDNDNCRGTDSIIVNPKDCLKGLYVPSAFTPNHDGKNDLLKPFLFGKINKFHFAIYNRWGQIVFQTSQPGQGWDGNYAGHQQDSNVFTWICNYQLDGEPAKTQKGTIVLIR